MAPARRSYTGVITPQPGVAGTAGLTKAGTGTLDLMNNNLYQGTTAINAGRLLANNPAGGSATGSGPVNVQTTGGTGGPGAVGGGEFGGTGTITGLTTVRSTATANQGGNLAGFAPGR